MSSDWIFRETIFRGVYKIRPFQANDDRGSLIKAFSQEVFLKYGVNFRIRETLMIESKKNVLRGIHFQREKPIDKLLVCVCGWIYVVVLDIRKDSGDFGKWISCELKPGEQIYVSEAYGLGTYALEDSLFLCMNGEKMYPDLDDGIKWDDSTISVKWPFDNSGGNPILSEKDKSLRTFINYEENI